MNYIEWNINSTQLKSLLKDELSSNPAGLDQDQKDQNKNNELEMSKMEDFEKFSAPNCNCQVRKNNSQFFISSRLSTCPETWSDLLGNIPN